MSAPPPLTTTGALRWDVVRSLWPSGVTDVLEIGCGQGAVGTRLARQHRYLGIELDEASSQVAAQRLAASGGTGVIRHGEVSMLAPDERFDVVCAFEVIEHIEDDRSALAAWVDLIRPGGWLLLSTPADQARFGAADEAVGHFRRYEPPAFADLLREAGLDDVKVVRYGGPTSPALEAVRNVVARRRLAQAGPTSIAERTHGSGRFLQPNSRVQAAALRTTALPLRALQRLFPDTGTGLVARARKPA